MAFNLIHVIQTNTSLHYRAQLYNLILNTDKQVIATQKNEPWPMTSPTAYVCISAVATYLQSLNLIFVIERLAGA